MRDLEPSSTYRLQLHAGFGFDEAADVCEYLGSLGVSHLYLSPILQATPGSMHGYDVVDHTRVSSDLGGVDGLRRLATTARRHGLGLVVDVVPNHMAFPTPAHLNAVWWEVLRDGRAAARAHWFDIDWELCGGRIGLPILGDELDAIVAQGQLAVDELDGEPVLRYFDQVLPLAPGTAAGPLDEVLASQHYLLADWRSKDEVLGYRRFFDVDTLVAVRVELPDVFEATHRTLVDLHVEGVITGFRIDHPDGLADPQGYLDALRAATDDAWVVVEKILAPGEQLPRSWAAAGTTGYDVIRAIQTSLAPSTGRQLDALWSPRLGVDLADIETRAKREVVHDLFMPEVLRLTRAATDALARAGELAEPALVRLALMELLVHVRTYRAYARLDEPVSESARRSVSALRADAASTRPDLAGVLALLEPLLLDTTSSDPATRDLVVRFQQVCGPVMAKGVEDTTFYRFDRFIALNEVGGDPDTLLSGGVDAVHDWARIQSDRFPLGMTTLSTHDTKRDEDVRARLIAAGEDIQRWTATWDLVARAATRLEVDLPTAYFVFQTVLGAWPITGDRLAGYVQKAVREAKQRTTWTEPNDAYEQQVQRLAAACVDDGPIAAAVEDWVADLAPVERAVNLSAKLIQLTVPGVPDVYQGAELTKYALVDPDNRRPVDFAGRATRLAGLDAGSARSSLDDDKLWVTSRAVRLRRRNPGVFGRPGGYRPIELATPHAIGFERAGPAEAAVITLATRRPFELAGRGWQGASLVLPDGHWVDDLTDATHEGEVALADVLSHLPVALLRRGTT